MSFYTISKAPNYVISVLLERRKLPARETLAKAILAATSNFKQVSIPDMSIREELAKKFGDRGDNVTRREAYLSGMNKMGLLIKRENTKEELAIKEAEEKLLHPIDLTLRQIAFLAKILGKDTMELVGNIANGLAPEKISNWRSKYNLEKQRHEESKKENTALRDQLKSLERERTTLRDYIHEKGLQDPTICSPRFGSNGSTYAVDTKDGFVGDFG
jgi:hypothetical protein